MNKSSVVILIIAAVVFTGLGFVVGQVMVKIPVVLMTQWYLKAM